MHRRLAVCLFTSFLVWSEMSSPRQWHELVVFREDRRIPTTGSATTTKLKFVRFAMMSFQGK